MLATNLRTTGRYRVKQPTGPVQLEPTNLHDLQQCLDPASRQPLPIRPQGAGTASTDCNASVNGTTLRMTAMDRIIRIDAERGTVTAEAGVPLEALVEALAEEGLELAGSYELAGRTIGGAVAAPCFGPSVGDNGAYFSSHVVAMKVVTADGKLLNIAPTQKNLLGTFRMSFGLLGVVYEVTLRVRQIRTFSASHRRVTIDKFAEIVDTLSASDVGFKFYLMPYRDRVYLDLRRYDADPGSAYAAPWKFKDWGETTVLPHVFRSLNLVMPIQSVRYNLIDTISEATQSLVNTRFVRSGSNAASQSSRKKTRNKRTRQYSTWCFPATDFSIVVKAFQEFCDSIYATSGYRCDLPVIGHRLCRDSTSPLSPSFDEPMIAVTFATTQSRGWEDFVIDLAEFAEKWGGMPMISQSRALRAEHTIQSYTNRLDFFRRTRRQLDPQNRLLSPFLAQFCQ